MLQCCIFPSTLHPTRSLHTDVHTRTHVTGTAVLFFCNSFHKIIFVFRKLSGC